MASATVIWWGVRSFSTRIIEKLDELIKTVASLDSKYIAQQVEIRNLKEKTAEHSRSIEGLRNKVNEVATKQAGCVNFRSHE